MGGGEQRWEITPVPCKSRATLKDGQICSTTKESTTPKGVSEEVPALEMKMGWK